MMTALVTRQPALGELTFDPVTACEGSVATTL